MYNWRTISLCFCRSAGFLVSNYLMDKDQDSYSYLKKVSTESHLYNGFNLITAEFKWVEGVVKAMWVCGPSPDKCRVKGVLTLWESLHWDLVSSTFVFYYEPCFQRDTFHKYSRGLGKKHSTASSLFFCVGIGRFLCTKSEIFFLEPCREWAVTLFLWVLAIPWNETTKAVSSSLECRQN